MTSPLQGGGERGVLVPDIEIGNALQVLPTGSSVLSIKLDQVSVFPTLNIWTVLIYLPYFDSISRTRACEMGLSLASIHACR